MSEPKRTVVHEKTMRGGLGRTLLTACLLLAIVPLAVMSIYAISRTRQQSQFQQEQQLSLLAESYRAQLAAASERAVQSLAYKDASPQWYLDEEGAPLEAAPPLPSWLDRDLPPSRWQAGGEELSLWIAAPLEEGWAATLVPVNETLARIRLPDAFSRTTLYLGQDSKYLPLTPDAPPLTREIEAGLRRLKSAPEQVVTTHMGEDEEAALVSQVGFGNGLSLALVQPEAEALVAADALAAALIAAALITALISTVGAALITRNITQPLYELTRTAVQIARGDLTQRAEVERDNELGILAFAFNTMANQLQETLDTLEERVEERTEALRAANEKIRRRARHLQLTAELGATLSSSQELEALLGEAARLVTSRFEYEECAIWLYRRRNGSPAALELRASTQPSAAAEGVPPGDLVEQVAEQGCAIASEDKLKLALPLRLADNMIGVLVLSRSEPFMPEDHPQLQILADTLTIAIENARASEVEHAAIQKLHHIEERRQQFLGEMSHELSTALNSIIGFSRLMLKEVEGPLTEMQRSDLTYINRNGTHLLSLLDGLLEVIEGEQGTGGHHPAADR